MNKLDEVVYLGKNRAMHGYPAKNIVGSLYSTGSELVFEAKHYLSLLNLGATVPEEDDISIPWSSITNWEVKRVYAHALLKYQLPVWAVVLTCTKPSQAEPIIFHFHPWENYRYASPDQDWFGGGIKNRATSLANHIDKECRKLPKTQTR